MRMNNCAAALASMPHSLGTSPPGDSQTARQQLLTSDEPQTFKIFESTYVTPTFASLVLKSELKTNDASMKTLISRFKHVVSNHDYIGDVRVGERTKCWFRISARPEAAEDSLGIYRFEHAPPLLSRVSRRPVLRIFLSYLQHSRCSPRFTPIRLGKCRDGHPPAHKLVGSLWPARRRNCGI